MKARLSILCCTMGSAVLLSGCAAVLASAAFGVAFSALDSTATRMVQQREVVPPDARELATVSGASWRLRTNYSFVGGSRSLLYDNGTQSFLLQPILFDVASPSAGPKLVEVEFLLANFDTGGSLPPPGAELAVSFDTQSASLRSDSLRAPVSSVKHCTHHKPASSVAITLESGAVLHVPRGKIGCVRLAFLGAQADARLVLEVGGLTLGEKAVEPVAVGYAAVAEP